MNPTGQDEGVLRSNRTSGNPDCDGGYTNLCMC